MLRQGRIQHDGKAQAKATSFARRHLCVAGHAHGVEIDDLAPFHEVVARHKLDGLARANASPRRRAPPTVHEHLAEARVVVHRAAQTSAP